MKSKTILLYLLFFINKSFGQCAPATVLNVINITSNSASVAWTASTSSNIIDYDVCVRTANNTPINSTQPTASTTSTSALINGLMPATLYYYWVRSVCSNLPSSGWIAGGTFSTLAQIQNSCNGAFYGLFPSATFTPLCSGNFELITNSSVAGQYTNVNLASNTQYIFQSSIGTDYLTITNSSGTQVLVKGSSPLTWNSGNFSGQARYFLHSQVACGISTSARSRFIKCVNLETQNYDNESFIYHPNPTSGILNINYSENISEISVINQLGQLIINNKENANQIKLDLSNLPSDIYLVKVISDGNSKTIKVIKE